MALRKSGEREFLQCLVVDEYKLMATSQKSDVVNGRCT